MNLENERKTLRERDKATKKENYVKENIEKVQNKTWLGGGG